MDFQKLKEVNARMKTIDLKGKAYSEVSQRIMGFKELVPDGSIETECTFTKTDAPRAVLFKAIVKDADGKIIATGHAEEKEDSSFINKTSFIENCETSAVGRALGMLGIGSETSVASSEEVQNAIVNQNKPTQAKKAAGTIDQIKIDAFTKKCVETKLDLAKVLKFLKLRSLNDMNLALFKNCMDNWDQLMEKANA